jgi:hypothetical protein
MTSIGPPHFGQSQASLTLREDLPPTQASFQRLDLDRLVKEWDEIVAGVSFALNFLDEKRFLTPSGCPLSVSYTLWRLSKTAYQESSMLLEMQRHFFENTFGEHLLRTDTRTTRRPGLCKMPEA